MEETNTQPQNSSFNPMIVGAVVVVLAVVGIGAITMKGKGAAVTEPAPVTQESSPAVQGISDTASSADSAVTTIEVEAGSFYFKPNEIRVKKGEKVKIVMHSVDMMHDFNIDELGVKLPITKSGETSEVEFVAKKAGTFEYYCSVGQHRKRGQIGTLIVE